jgi:hypothetical protein
VAPLLERVAARASKGPRSTGRGGGGSAFSTGGGGGCRWQWRWAVAGGRGGGGAVAAARRSRPVAVAVGGGVGGAVAVAVALVRWSLSPHRHIYLGRHPGRCDVVALYRTSRHKGSPSPGSDCYKVVMRPAETERKATGGRPQGIRRATERRQEATGGQQQKGDRTARRGQRQTAPMTRPAVSVSGSRLRCRPVAPGCVYPTNPWSPPISPLRSPRCGAPTPGAARR